MKKIGKLVLAAFEARAVDPPAANRISPSWAGFSNLIQIVKLAAMSIVLTLGLAEMASAQAWGDWVSTEQSKVCNGGIVGFATKGPYGAQHRQRCNKSSIIQEDLGFKEHINDRQGLQEKICEGGFINRFACNGKYCSYIRIGCAYNTESATTSLYDHRWLTVKQSEEAPNNTINFSKYNKGVKTVLVGLRCSESWCDTLEFYVAKVGTPAAVAVSYGQGKGKWVSFCDGGGPSCTVTLEESVSTGGSSSKSTTFETASSISVGLSLGVKVGGDNTGGSVESVATTEASHSMSTSIATTAAENWGSGSQRTQKVDIPYETYNVFRVWRWQVKLPASDSTFATIKTTSFTCTPGPEYPPYLPGSPEHVANPCLVKRGSATSSTASNVSYKFNYGNNRSGVLSMKPGSLYSIYDEKGGCGPNDIAQCQLNRNGTVQAKYSDSCSRPVVGPQISDGCSEASFKNYTVTCCTR